MHLMFLKKYFGLLLQFWAHYSSMMCSTFNLRIGDKIQVYPLKKWNNCLKQKFHKFFLCFAQYVHFWNDFRIWSLLFWIKFQNLQGDCFNFFGCRIEYFVPSHLHYISYTVYTHHILTNSAQMGGQSLAYERLEIYTHKQLSLADIHKIL